ncbi:hypothetical protein LINGRAHAP2_LOCUS5733 [Linum grandiflorum]
MEGEAGTAVSGSAQSMNGGELPTAEVEPYLRELAAKFRGHASWIVSFAEQYDSTAAAIQKRSEELKLVEERIEEAMKELERAQEAAKRKTVELEAREDAFELLMKDEIAERRKQMELVEKLKKEMEAEKATMDGKLKEIGERGIRIREAEKEVEQKRKELEGEEDGRLAEFRREQAEFEVRVSELNARERELNDRQCRENETNRHRLDEFHKRNVEFDLRLDDLSNREKEIEEREEQVKELERKAEQSWNEFNLHEQDRLAEFKVRDVKFEEYSRQLKEKRKETKEKKRRVNERLQRIKAREKEFRKKVVDFEKKESEFERNSIERSNLHAQQPEQLFKDQVESLASVEAVNGAHTPLMEHVSATEDEVVELEYVGASHNVEEERDTIKIDREKDSMTVDGACRCGSDRVVDVLSKREREIEEREEHVKEIERKAEQSWNEFNLHEQDRLAEFKARDVKFEEYSRQLQEKRRETKEKKRRVNQRLSRIKAREKEFQKKVVDFENKELEFEQNSIERSNLHAQQPEQLSKGQVEGLASVEAVNGEHIPLMERVSATEDGVVELECIGASHNVEKDSMTVDRACRSGSDLVVEETVDDKDEEMKEDAIEKVSRQKGRKAAKNIKRPKSSEPSQGVLRSCKARKPNCNAESNCTAEGEAVSAKRKLSSYNEDEKMKEDAIEKVSRKKGSKAAKNIDRPKSSELSQRVLCSSKPRKPNCNAESNCTVEGELVSAKGKPSSYDEDEEIEEDSTEKVSRNKGREEADKIQGEKNFEPEMMAGSYDRSNGKSNRRHRKRSKTGEGGNL